MKTIGIIFIVLVVGAVAFIAAAVRIAKNTK